MKIFGKQGDSYIVSIPKQELLQIVFGVVYSDNSKLDVQEFLKKIESVEVEANVSKVFVKMMTLHSMDLNESYHGLIAKIEALKGLLTPLNDYIVARNPNKTE